MTPEIKFNEIINSPQERILDLSRQKDKVRNIPVCLIIPPSSFLADERVFPFLGILKVAAQLRDNGNEVDVIDCSGYGNPDEIVKKYIDEHPSVKTFGLTATTPQIVSCGKILQQIRDSSHDSKVILGGTHATLTHAGYLQELKTGTERGRATVALSQLNELFDTIVAGDGEMSIFYAIDNENNQKLIDAGNLSSPLFIKRGELDQYTPAARELIDHESYKYYIDGKRAASLIAQLGCPFECGFCGGRDSQFLRMIRTRTIPNIIDEMGQIIDSSKNWEEPIRAIMFYDDELNVSPQNLENLCKALIDYQAESGLELRFRGFVKAELFTQEQANLMYKAGFREVLSGVESGSDLMLKAMRKHTSRDINSRCVKYAHNAGLNFKALMSLGHPGESYETIQESIDWVKDNLRVGDQVDWTVITVFFGTPYSDRATYIKEDDVWVYETKVLDDKTKTTKILKLYSKRTDQFLDAQFYKGIPDGYKAYVWTDFITQDELVTQRGRAENETRAHLNLPHIQSVTEMQYEHTMGMPGNSNEALPSKILRSSKTIYSAN